MSFKNQAALTKLRGLLMKAGDAGMSYEQLDQQTDGMATDIFDDALAELVAKDEVTEKDGHYTFVQLQPDTARPVASSDTRKVATLAPPPASTPAPTAHTQEIPPMAPKPEKSDELRAAILKFMEKAGATAVHRAKEILEGSDFPRGTKLSAVKYQLKLLAKDGKVTVTGKSSGTRYSIVGGAAGKNLVTHRGEHQVIDAVDPKAAIKATIAHLTREGQKMLDTADALRELL